MSTNSPLAIHYDTVRPEWVDYNGHLRDAFYLLIFSFASDALIDFIGLDETARNTRRRSMYTLEAHVNYLREIKEGVQVRVDVRVLAYDAKRLHVYFEMFTSDPPELVAVSEQLFAHVDTSERKSAPFDPDILARIEALAAAHTALRNAHYAGRVIGLPVRSTK
jgi:acyl-CoA thioester hydrolase